jgi:hypothetical protein
MAGAGTMLYRAKRPVVLTIPQNSTAPETAGAEPFTFAGKRGTCYAKSSAISVSALWKACGPNQAAREITVPSCR